MSERLGPGAMWRVVWVCAALGLLAFLTFYNLEAYPRTWFDEGVHLLAAQRLAVEGRYLFGPAVGPTVFFPVAIGMRIWGVGLTSARLVMAGYLVLAIGAFFCVARTLSGSKVAWLAALLFVFGSGVNLLYVGRQVLGEVPALLFLLSGLWGWCKALDEARPIQRRLVLIWAGICFGLAVLSKNQFLLWLPAWIATWLMDRVYYRQARHVDFWLPLIAALVCVAAWYATQALMFPYGKQLASYNSQEWASSLSRGIFTLSSQRMLAAAKFVTGEEAFLGWALPAYAYGVLRALRRSTEGLRWAALALVTLAWLGWFVLLSVGWPRYAFPAMALCAIFVAQFFHDATDGYRVPLGELRHMGALKLDVMVRLVLMVCLLVLLVRSLQGRLAQIVTGGSTQPQQMAAFIKEYVPAQAEIETYEPEVCFLSGYACHMPPSAAMDASIKFVWYSGPVPFKFYHFREYGAPYLLIGQFGRWVQIYDPDIVARDYVRVVSIGDYELYQLK